MVICPREGAVVTRGRRIARVGSSALIGSALLVASLTAQDWPQWRGPQRDGAVAGFREPAAWPQQLNRQWTLEVGLGYATPLVVGDRVFVFARQEEDEVLMALDAASGRQIWKTGYAAPFAMMSATARHGPGPKSTPAYANGRIFTLGMTSIVTAFDAATGRQLWQTPATKAQPMYHTALSPLVDGNLVIVHVGGPGDAALSALDVATGAIRWTWRGDSPAYGSPIVAELAGTRQVVTYTHRYLVGVHARTGELLWQRPFRTPSDTTSQTPLLYGDLVIQTGRANGIAAFRVSRTDAGWATEDLWQTMEVSLHMTNGVVVGDVLYGLSHLNAGQYFGLDLRTGKVLWTSPPRQAENAALARAGRTIFALEDDAELLVLTASRTGMDVVGRYQVADSETWAQPAISGNRVFVKDVSRLTVWTVG